MKILLNILTHGDELIGLSVAEGIRNKYPRIIGNELDIQIANEKAYQSGKRYIDDDLNRVFPGNTTEDSYEKKRAVELKKTIEKYDFVIDIHSTKSETENTVIVTKFDDEIKKILKFLSPKYVLFMSMKPDKSLLSCARLGLAFEIGRDKDEQTLIKTLEGVEKLLLYFGLVKIKKEFKNFSYHTKYFDVSKQVEKPKGAILESKIKNFTLIKKGETFAKNDDGSSISADEDFYPVIFGKDNYETIFGFSAKKIDL